MPFAKPKSFHSRLLCQFLASLIFVLVAIGSRAAQPADLDQLLGTSPTDKTIVQAWYDLHFSSEAVDYTDADLGAYAKKYGFVIRIAKYASLDMFEPIYIDVTRDAGAPPNLSGFWWHNDKNLKFVTSTIEELAGWRVQKTTYDSETAEPSITFMKAKMTPSQQKYKDLVDRAVKTIDIETGHQDINLDEPKNRALRDFQSRDATDPKELGRTITLTARDLTNITAKIEKSGVPVITASGSLRWPVERKDKRAVKKIQASNSCSNDLRK